MSKPSHTRRSHGQRHKAMIRATTPTTGTISNNAGSETPDIADELIQANKSQLTQCVARREVTYNADNFAQRRNTHQCVLRHKPTVETHRFDESTVDLVVYNSKVEPYRTIDATDPSPTEMEREKKCRIQSHSVAHWIIGLTIGAQGIRKRHVTQLYE